MTPSAPTARARRAGRRRRARGHGCNSKEPQVTVEHPHLGERQGCFKLEAWASELEEAFQGTQVKPLISQVWKLCAEGESAGEARDPLLKCIRHSVACQAKGKTNLSPRGGQRRWDGVPPRSQPGSRALRDLGQATEPPSLSVAELSGTKHIGLRYRA